MVVVVFRERIRVPSQCQEVEARVWAWENSMWRGGVLSFTGWIRRKFTNTHVFYGPASTGAECEVGYEL